MNDIENLSGEIEIEIRSEIEMGKLSLGNSEDKTQVNKYIMNYQFLSFK